MTVTAAVPAGVGNVTYVWYLNGESKATGSSASPGFTLGSTLAAGFYRLDVTALHRGRAEGGSCDAQLHGPVGQSHGERLRGRGAGAVRLLGRLALAAACCLLASCFGLFRDLQGFGVRRADHPGRRRRLEEHGALRRHDGRGLRRFGHGPRRCDVLQQFHGLLRHAAGPRVRGLDDHGGRQERGKHDRDAGNGGCPGHEPGPRRRSISSCTPWPAPEPSRFQ